MASDPNDRFRTLADDLVTRLSSRESRSHAEAMIAEELVAAYAAGQAEALAWRPIETAPRDGTAVDLLIDGPYGLYRKADAWWSAHGRWTSHSGYAEATNRAAIGWMPPPSVAVPPPAAEPAREDGA